MASRVNMAKDLSRKLVYALIAKAAEGRSMSWLSNLSESTFQDALLYPCMAHGSQGTTIWWAETESRLSKDSWEAWPDVVVYKRTTHGNTHKVGAIELKWWRGGADFNVTNRRGDLFKDIMRASAFSKVVNNFALVCLVSTHDAWDKVLSAKSPESRLLESLDIIGKKTKLKPDTDLERVYKEITNKDSKWNIPVSTSIHVELLHKCTLSIGDDRESVAARCWLVSKPSGSRNLWEKAQPDSKTEN